MHASAGPADLQTGLKLLPGMPQLEFKGFHSPDNRGSRWRSIWAHRLEHQVVQVQSGAQISTSILQEEHRILAMLTSHRSKADLPASLPDAHETFVL